MCCHAGTVYPVGLDSGCTGQRVFVDADPEVLEVEVVEPAVPELSSDDRLEDAGLDLVPVPPGGLWRAVVHDLDDARYDVVCPCCWSALLSSLGSDVTVQVLGGRPPAAHCALCASGRRVLILRDGCTFSVSGARSALPARGRVSYLGVLGPRYRRRYRLCHFSSFGSVSNLLVRASRRHLLHLLIFSAELSAHQASGYLGDYVLNRVQCAVYFVGRDPELPFPRSVGISRVSQASDSPAITARLVHQLVDVTGRVLKPRPRRSNGVGLAWFRLATAFGVISRLRGSGAAASG